MRSSEEGTARRGSPWWCIPTLLGAVRITPPFGNHQRKRPSIGRHTFNMAENFDLIEGDIRPTRRKRNSRKSTVKKGNRKISRRSRRATSKAKLLYLQKTGFSKNSEEDALLGDEENRLEIYSIFLRSMWWAKNFRERFIGIDDPSRGRYRWQHNAPEGHETMNIYIALKDIFLQCHGTASVLRRKKIMLYKLIRRGLTTWTNFSKPYTTVLRVVCLIKDRLVGALLFFYKAQQILSAKWLWQRWSSKWNWVWKSKEGWLGVNRRFVELIVHNHGRRAYKWKFRNSYCVLGSAWE